MSATTTDRRETRGFVSETLRRPIQEAVREGVEEALDEQQTTTRTRPSGRSDDDEGGRSWGRFLLLALIGIGAAYVVMQRRGGSDARDRTTSEIRERSKTATTPAQPDVGGEESAETMAEGIEGGGTDGEDDAAHGAAPGAESEDD